MRVGVFVRDYCLSLLLIVNILFTTAPMFPPFEVEEDLGTGSSGRPSYNGERCVCVFLNNVRLFVLTRGTRT